MGRQQAARRRRLIGYGEALAIGVAQASALVPGISRSGATLTVAMLLGLRRDAAARFVFLLSLPAVLAAAVKEALEVAKVGVEGLPVTLFAGRPGGVRGRRLPDGEVLHPLSRRTHSLARLRGLPVGARGGDGGVADRPPGEVARCAGCGGRF